MAHNLLGRGLRSRNGSRNASPAGSRSSSPRPPSESSLILKIYIIKAKDLAALDRGGTSDPYVVITLDDFKATTQAISKTLNPEWNAEFSIGLSPAVSELLLIEGTVWDKDRFKKDYLGSFDISLPEHFGRGQENGLVVADIPTNKPRWYDLYSAKTRKTYVKGSIFVKLALADTTDPTASNDVLLEKWNALLSKTGPAGSISDYESDGLASPNNEDESGVSENESARSKSRRQEKRRERRQRLKQRQLMNLYQRGGDSDLAGVVFFEIVKVTDLPPERNVTRTGFDMDPFVVVSLGKSVVRTDVQRHNLNPIYNDKFLFQIIAREQNYVFTITVIDRDALSNNDFVARAQVPLQEILMLAQKPNPESGVYEFQPAMHAHVPIKKKRVGKKDSSTENKKDETSSSSSSPPATDDETMHTFEIPLILANKTKWEGKHQPVIEIRAKYMPYEALRQQFWHYLIRQFDDDDSGYISRIELSNMLEHIGSTLRQQTIERFFLENGKTEIDDDIEIDKVVAFLESQVEKECREMVDYTTGSSSRASAIPILVRAATAQPDETEERDDTLTEATVAELDRELEAISSEDKAEDKAVSQTSFPLDMEAYLEEIDEDESEVERVMTIRECPICHQPRLDMKAEVDIVTHLALCASQGWSQVDTLAISSHVTAEQASRKWVGKVVSKISYGGYKLGANSANILVQDRITGYISEERMSPYVRTGIRLLYRGLKAREMERSRIRKMLASMSVKQGRKYDNPRSVKAIKPFIQFHQLDLSSVLKPLDQFKSFNDFFYRELKPGSRPCAAASNPKIAVSPADCRSVVFESIEEATKIWIKGKDFSIRRLFGDAYADEVKSFIGGSLGIFRLAPQDYHRFHVPVDGVLGKPKLIEGAYYTVNPMAIRSALDVYGENVRVLVPIDSEAFGRVMIVCVGAMMVGSTVITAQAGARVSRTDELGYFKFGGSTLVVLFQPGKISWDSDLRQNTKESLETLIEVGMSVGHAPDEAECGLEYARKRLSAGETGELSEEEIAEVARRIDGSLAPLRREADED
ncbi:phosphatidylserine decarboxylase-like protein [Myxozyma melibiosi]|uniref:Phosphatidylserine decarboxylase proenzyme 2 n=1 Tax=Myxozyma melibiosi TaxID=54550 RepID=A0ABR1F2P2_9ASCO